MISAYFPRTMNLNQNNSPKNSPTDEDTGTDGLKFDLPVGQTPGEGLGNGKTGMRAFNSNDPDAKDDLKADEADWDEATGDGEKSGRVSVRDQDNSTV